MHLILIDSLHIDHLVYFAAEVYRFCIARMDLPFIYINLTSIDSNDDERILAHSCLSTNALLVEKSHTFTSLRRTWSMNKTAALARSYLHFGFPPLIKKDTTIFPACLGPISGSLFPVCVMRT